jgi:hypothetical protein
VLPASSPRGARRQSIRSMRSEWSSASFRLLRGHRMSAASDRADWQLRGHNRSPNIFRKPSGGLENPSASLRTQIGGPEQRQLEPGRRLVTPQWPAFDRSRRRSPRRRSRYWASSSPNRMPMLQAPCDAPHSVTDSGAASPDTRKLTDDMHASLCCFGLTCRWMCLDLTGPSLLTNARV